MSHATVIPLLTPNNLEGFYRHIQRVLICFKTTKYALTGFRNSIQLLDRLLGLKRARAALKR